MRERADSAKNAGMTLVELLVAVTMLAIVVVPLLHALASSAQVGLKARRTLRATTAAQDIMEGLKAESIESLSCSFNYPDDDTATTLSAGDNSFANFHVISSELIRNDAGAKDSGNVFEVKAKVDEDPSSANYGKVTFHRAVSGVDASTLLETGRYSFVGNDDKKYYFAIRNMQIEGGDDPNFVVDALIGLDGSNYTSLGTNQKTSLDGTDKALLNEHGRISYGTLNEKRDAFFIQEEALGRQTAQEFNVAYASWTGTECTEKDLSRKFVVTVTDETALDNDKQAANGAHWITVTCRIVYTSSSAFQIPPEHEKYKEGLGDQPYTKEYEYTIFDNKTTGYAPDNIFLCYYPGYGAPAADEIVYVNAQSVPSVLHLIKQEGKNNGTLNHDELNYKCKVRINEGAGASEEDKGNIYNRSDSVTKVRTNLDTNMYKVYLPSAPECRNQAEYRYNGTVIYRDFNNPEAGGIYTLGGDVHTSDSMYDVTIDIYEQGTLDAILSNTVSVDDAKSLFTLKGSMN